MSWNDISVEVLVGLELKSIENTGDEINIETTTGRRFQMYHSQDCCESVWVEDVCGDLEDLIGSPILMAESRTCDNDINPGNDSSMWTFYEFRTIKGSVTIRWLGESNGYYGVGVDFVETTPAKDEADSFYH